MARSLKKGPFVDSHLMDRIEELNRKNEKQFSKLGRVVPLLPRILSGIQYQSIMEKSFFRYS